jgi:hypothetical protein
MTVRKAQYHAILAADICQISRGGVLAHRTDSMQELCAAAALTAGSETFSLSLWR